MMHLSSLLPSLPFSPETIVWGIFALALGTFTVFTLILLYHWFRYAEKKSVLTLAGTIYTIVSGFIFMGLIAGTALLLT